MRSFSPRAACPPDRCDDERDCDGEEDGPAERELIARVAQTYHDMADLLGYRLRPELDATFETIASLVSASIRGLVLMSPSTPQIATQRIRANPFGTTDTAEWSQPALGTAGVVFTFLEPDPTIEWNEQRLAAVRQTLQAPNRPAP